MKIKSIGEIIINVYVHCWYIPLFAFLLGIKLCLITMLVDSIQKGEHVRYEGLVNTELSKLSSSMKSKSYLRKQHHHKYHVTLTKSTSTSTTTTTVSPDLMREWELLADLENSIIEPSSKNRTDPNSIWVIFNRIPRTGGQSMVQLLHKLGEANGFSHQEHEYRTPWPRFLLEQEQENLVTWFEYQHLPKSYDRHFYFVNFTSYQKYIKEQPIYINIVRDPILRLKSFYQSKRNVEEVAKLEIARRNEISPEAGLEWFHRTFEECVILADLECNYEGGMPDFTMMVPFFCGQHPSCVILNDKWAIQRAKFTIEKYYSVVGILEKWNQTLTVLENYIPKFFQNSNQIYYEKKSTDFPHKKRRRRQFENPTSTTSMVSNTLRSLLESKLEGEYELYHFVEQRLAKQIARINSI